MAALIVGTILALGALAYVLWPLIAAAEGRPAVPASPPAPTATPDPQQTEGPVRVSEAPDDDPVEAAIRRARAQTRVCPVCGPRPEPAARYCSRCGKTLA